MPRPRSRRWALGLGAAGCAVALFLATSAFVALRFSSREVEPSEVPSAPLALVFGAGLSAGGEPSHVLAQRLDTAIALYLSGKVGKLLLSGDTTGRYHDETLSMRRYVEAHGVPHADVWVDDLGVSTYDSCARAYEVFGVRRAVLVTQGFHLPRALYVANALGIDAWGVAADPGGRPPWNYELRELFSRPVALWLVLTRAPSTPGASAPADAR